MRWTPDHDSMLFLGVNLLSREGNSQTGFRRVSCLSGCSSRLFSLCPFYPFLSSAVRSFKAFTSRGQRGKVIGGQISFMNARTIMVSAEHLFPVFILSHMLYLMV